MSSFTGFTWSAYTRMSLCFVGMIANTINILVLVNPKLKDISYKLMLAKSASNLVYLGFALTTEIVSYCSSCPWSTYYFSSLFFIIGGIFAPVTLTMFRVLVEIALSIYTYCILINKPWTRKYTYLWILIGCALFSIGFYLYKCFYFNIKQVPGMNIFYISSTALYISEANKVLSIIQTLIRIILAVVVVGIINFWNLILFRKRFQNHILPNNSTNSTINRNTASLNQDQLTAVANEHSARLSFRLSVQTNKRGSKPIDEISRRMSHNDVRGTQNITRMVIVSLILNALSQIPYSVGFIISTCGVNSSQEDDLNVISYFFLYFWPTLDLLVYYFFNKHFKSVLNGYIKKICCIR